MKQLFAVAVVSLLMAGCGNQSDIVVVTQVVRNAANVSAAVPDEFGGSAPSMGELYWVEGTARNDGATEALNVSITFRCTDGNTNRLFVAEIPRIAAGETVTFRTDRYPSALRIKLLDSPPEIKVGK